MKRYEIRSYGLHSEWEAVISEDGDWADYADVEKLIAENASLKRCGTCRHWRTWSAVCCIQQAEKIRKETCDKWEIDE